MIAVGVFVRPRAITGRLLIGFAAARFLLGSLLGLTAALVLGMRGLDMVTLICAPLLPVGTTALVYAGNEGLDAEFCAALISLTAIAGALLYSILPMLLGQVLL
jgi:predicted permease